MLQLIRLRGVRLMRTVLKSISILTILFASMTSAFALETVIGRYNFKPNTMNIVQPALDKLIKSTRDEPGNISYVLYHQQNHPNRVVFIEQWKNAAAHKIHLKTKHVMAAHKVLDPLLATKPEDTIIDDASIKRKVSTANPNTLFQVATIGSLAQGVYDGDYRYADVMTHGDFGVGTFKDLNGEMVAVDGHFYQIEASGKLIKVSPQQVAPFAAVVHFHPSKQRNIANLNNYKTLADTIIRFIPNKNIPYAISIKGKFDALKLRSLRKQNKPYPNLVTASKQQAIFNLHNVRGDIVGFWFPKYWAGIAVPGFHLHFVSKNRQIGGHVLGIHLARGTLAIQPIHQVEVYLPNTKTFAKANLSAENLNNSIHKAEGGHQK